MASPCTVVGDDVDEDVAVGTGVWPSMLDVMGRATCGQRGHGRLDVERHAGEAGW